MKKWFSLFLFAVSGTLLAGKLEIDGQFKRLKADGLPQAWLIQGASKPDCGSFKLTETPEGKAISVTAAATNPARYYTVPVFTVKNAKQLTVSLKVKCTGKFGISLFLYDAKGAWLSTIPVAEIENSENWKELRGEIEIPATCPVRANGEFTDKPVGSFRIALVTSAGSQASFADVKAELK